MTATVRAFPLEKLPPSNTDAEQATLGAIIIDPLSIERVSTWLKPDDFFRESHRLIYEAALRLQEQAVPVDVVLLADELERAGTLAEVGGVAYIHSLATVVPTAIHLEHYANVVRRTAVKRKLITVGGRIAGVGFDDTLEVDQALDEASQLLAEIAATNLNRNAGIFTVADIEGQIDRLYEDGWSAGVDPGWPKMRDHYRPTLGDWTLVTGIPGHGKSAFLDALMMNLSFLHGWSFGICSPENQPLERHFRKLAQLYVGKPFDRGVTERMTYEELAGAKTYGYEHFVFVLPIEHQRTVEGILTVMERAVYMHHLKGIVIDPWNEIDSSRPRNMSETEFISRSLTRIRNFARHHRVHVWLVAHPTKLEKKPGTDKYPVPRPYDVSGSHTWWDKSDNCLSVYRDDDDRWVQIHVQKIRNQGLNGKLGMVELLYDKVTGRYHEPGAPPTKAPYWVKED